MNSHRYVRPFVSQSDREGKDSYNILLRSPQDTPDEYWTNGSTTLYSSTDTSSRDIPTEYWMNSSSTELYSATNQLIRTPEKNILFDKSTGEVVDLENHKMSNASIHNNFQLSGLSSASAMSQSPERYNQAQKQLAVDAAQLSVRNSLLAGSCAGITSTLILYPLDVVRTKLQTSTGDGPFRIFRNTINHGGIRALYTGIAVPVMAQSVYKGTVFTVNNMTLKFLVDYRTFENYKSGYMEKSQRTLMDHFWGGLIGGAVNGALFVTPVEYIRNQLIAQHTRLAAGDKVQQIAKGSIDIIKNSLQQKQGVFSLWRGITWTVYRDSLGCGCFFYTMACCQQVLTPPNERPTLISTIVSGGIGGLAYWVSALPLDTIKTWVQSSDAGTTSATTSTALTSPTSTIRIIYHEHGLVEVLQRLFRGWQVAYGRGIPSAAITMTTYSFVHNHLSGYDGFSS